MNKWVTSNGTLRQSMGTLKSSRVWTSTHSKQHLYWCCLFQELLPDLTWRCLNHVEMELGNSFDPVTFRSKSRSPDTKIQKKKFWQLFLFFQVMFLFISRLSFLCIKNTRKYKRCILNVSLRRYWFKSIPKHWNKSKIVDKTKVTLI